MVTSNKINAPKYTFFGSSRLSVIVLDEMMRLGMSPSLIVTTPDKPQGRKLVLTPNVVKQWAIDNNISFLAPLKLDQPFIDQLKSAATELGVALFIVASYGRIIPASVLEIPLKGALNIHPSLLPQYRGPSPLPTAILEDTKHTGITIMKVDNEMDHGPVVAKIAVDITEWPTYEDFEEMMAKEGAKLLADTLPKYFAGEITPEAQDHSKATYTKKMTKEEALIDFAALKEPQNISRADQYTIFRKIQAYHEWPQAYFMADKRGKQIRVKITSASFADGKLTIEKVIPEGSKEMTYEDFLRGLN